MQREIEDAACATLGEVILALRREMGEFKAREAMHF